MVLSAVIDFLHQLATVVWIGGMIYANLVLAPSLNVIAAAERGKLMSAAIRKFTFYAWLSVALLILTGIFKAKAAESEQLTQMQETFLHVKYALFALMFIIGLLMTVVIGPKLARLNPKSGEKPSPEFLKLQEQMMFLARANMIIGVLVLAVVALV